MAALVPGPLVEPITWIAEEATIDCEWVEDPNAPVCLYYTDAACLLGASEQVVRDSEYWDAWLELAYQCDQARWFGNDSTLIVYPEGSPVRGDSGVCGDTLTIMPSAPEWLGAEVDFATHAVLILRADEQSRWGGGVWLDAIETGPSGSTIIYTTMTPSGDCPPSDGEILRPTAAIRVPLPLPESIAWVRNDDVIDCNWVESGSADPSPPPKR